MTTDKNSTDKNDKQLPVKGPLGLSGEQYWNDPVSFVSDFGEDRLFNNEEGLVIDAPEKVFIKEQKSVPLVCLRTIARHKLRKYSLETTTQLLVVNLETGNTDIVKLMLSPDIKDEHEVSRGYSNEWHVADLQKDISPLNRAIMQIASYPGRNILTLLCGPEQSNRRTIEVIPDKESEKNGSYLEKTVSLRTSSLPPDISSGLLLEPRHLAPPPPGEDALWEVTKTEEGDDDFRVSIQYRIRGLPSFVYSKELRPFDTEKNQVFAALPIHTVIFDHDRSLLVSRTIVLPVINPPAGDGNEPVFSGHTSFLLSKIASFLDKKYLYAWFICMDNIQPLEIEIEKGWTDGLVPPPVPVPSIKQD